MADCTHGRTTEDPYNGAVSEKTPQIFFYLHCRLSTRPRFMANRRSIGSLARPDVPGKGNVWSLLPAFRDSMEFHSRDVTS